ncbi:hypothetical protein SO802_023266 [Lithocarpus litseifolius]|uniref:Uncharacterized protein n=1 Tax=Lithocarpus litseifolius TaxID=425828 RepID=A0AAW2C6J1_9ROSI
MANSFLEYYRFNVEIAPDRTVLMRTEKKRGEPFREYAQRWRELATQVQSPMMENEMIKCLIPIGEHISEGIRSKKIMDAESLSSVVEQQVKKMTGRKIKEADVHMVDNASERPRGVASTYATPTVRPC